MSKIIMVTGGARSGKSEFAEKLARERGVPVLYVATAKANDEEMEERVKLHRERRPVDWETMEAPEGLNERLLEKNSDDEGGPCLILLDCVTVYISNFLVKNWDNWDYSKEKEIEAEFKKVIGTINNNDLEIIIVTNEVGFGLVPEYKMGRVFRDLAGKVNKLIADSADEVYLVLAGQPKRFK